MKGLASRTAVGLLLELSISLAAQAGVVDPDLKARLKTLRPNQEVSVIVTLTTQANLNAIRDREHGVRNRKVVQALRQHADLKQASVLDFLKRNLATGAKQLWIINGIAARVPARVVRALALRPGVAHVQLDSTLYAPGPSATTTAAPEWNINLIHAPEVWGLGYTGQGTVVANMDTGVDKDHPDLGPRWRGGANSWFDPNGQHTTPTDYAGSSTGHGTQTMGLMVGGEAGGTAIGVAPGARWIAVKVFDDQGLAQESDLHQGFQWLLDPDGNPLTDDAPDVVNASFRTASTGVCDRRFETDIQNLKTASIAVVFAAGNSGPLPGTSVSPANNSVGYGAGAVDNNSTIASFSSRGPSACDGGLFPKLVAPGVNVNTADISSGGFLNYRTVNGTSFAAPHVAGGMALLMEAFPNIAVSALESALTDSATDLGTTGPDQDYGHGILHVLQAHAELAAAAGQKPVAVEDSYTMNEDATLSVPVPGVLNNDTDPQNDALAAALVSDVSHGTLTLNADGSFIYSPVPDYQGTDSFTYKASDGLHDSGVATVAITINPVNDPPAAANDGPYTATAGTTLNIPAPGLLNNDSDIDQDILTAQGPIQAPANGSVTVNADGSFTYTPAPNFNGTDSFSYQANDGQTIRNLSNVASVTVTVVSVDDLPVFTSTAPTTASGGRLYTYAANATDLDSTVSYSLESGPAGMSIAGNVVSWTPATNQTGTQSFTVRATGTPGGGFTDQINTVNVAANTAPVANTDLFLYRANVTRTVNVPGTLGNDRDAENDPLTAKYVAGSLASGGTLTCPSSASTGICPDGSFSYFRALGSNYVSFRYRTSDGLLLSAPSFGATVSLRVDAAPVAVDDNCSYDRSANTVTQPARCTVMGFRTVLMNVAANDTDSNRTTNVPTDGVGKTVVPGSMLITAVGSGVNVLANTACGQGAQGIAPGTRATITNNCDGTVSVAMAAANSLSIGYSYRVSDDLGAQSGTRQVTLSSMP
jgi:VCBS repeat-containing protein